MHVLIHIMPPKSRTSAQLQVDQNIKKVEAPANQERNYLLIEDLRN